VPGGNYPFRLWRLSHRSRLASRPWTSNRPRNGHVMYMVHNGYATYRRYQGGPYIEPPWLRYLNHMNGYTPVKTCEIVRSYLRKRFGGDVILGDYIWFSKDELNSIDSHLYDPNYLVKVSHDYLSWVASPPEKCRTRTLDWRPKIDILYHPGDSRIFRRGESAPSACKRIRRFGEAIQAYRLAVPDEVPIEIGIKPRLIKTESKRQNWRLCILKHLIKISYCIYAVYHPEYGEHCVHARRKALRLMRRDGVLMALHQTAKMPTCWQGPARSLFRRLKVIMAY